MLQGRRILLGVSGGIAAYKAADLASRLIKSGAEVRVVMTANAERFIAPLTFRTITNHPVATALFSDPQSPVPHISLATWPELIVIVPATADLISRTACGRANDLLSAVLLDTGAPIIWAPAMNTRMWQHPATQDNLKKLTEWGQQVVVPESGHLACGETGDGRLAGLDSLMEKIQHHLLVQSSLKDKKILITAGPTREPWDAIRFLSNRSSGKMGYALAEEAKNRGANVTLISGPVNLKPPVGVNFTSVETAEEMYKQAMAVYANMDVVIAAAAVADFRPKEPQQEKIKKHQMNPLIDLEANPDILHAMGSKKKQQLLVGFAAENENPIEGGRMKLENKNCDLIVANYASGPEAAFAKDQAKIMIINKNDTHQVECQAKDKLASIILNHVEKLLV